MENCRLAFYITTVLTSISVEVFWKIVCIGKRETKLCRHHFISMVCTLIEYGQKGKETMYAGLMSINWLL